MKQLQTGEYVGDNGWTLQQFIDDATAAPTEVERQEIAAAAFLAAGPAYERPNDDPEAALVVRLMEIAGIGFLNATAPPEASYPAEEEMMYCIHCGDRYESPARHGIGICAHRCRHCLQPVIAGLVCTCRAAIAAQPSATADHYYAARAAERRLSIGGPKESDG